jgi:AcrR family transcriptional regulator
MTARVVRLTQSERSARTRERLIAAATDALHRFGYAATSTTLVADMAGVSRGAMLHQFPSKALLMAAVANATHEANIAAYRVALARATNPRERVLMLLDTAWERHSAPSGVAQNEIWAATRSDPELAELILPIHEEQIRQTSEAQAAMLARAGVKDRALADAVLTLNVAAFRGLALEQALGADPAAIDAAVALLRANLDALLPPDPPAG